MRNTLPNHFQRNFFGTEEYHRNWLETLSSTTKKFIEENNSKEINSKIVIGLNCIYDRRMKELVDMEYKGIISAEQESRWLEEAIELINKFKESYL